jgi:hypothetical protein
MSFKTFIYYCALCGGWGAFLAWFGLDLAMGMNPETIRQELYAKGQVFTAGRAVGLTAAIAGGLGLFVAAAIGLVDSVLNAQGMQRLLRVMLCGLIGLAGGALGGLIGGGLYGATGGMAVMMLIGWMCVGTMVGASIGVFDLLRGLSTGDVAGAIKKTLNGIYGGLLGGFVGGLPFMLLMMMRSDDPDHPGLAQRLPHGGLATSLVLLGICIGLLVGLAQVILKQAWLRVEEGFRPGRELLMTKEETTIGRAEGSDLILLADNTIAKLHAKIRKKNNRYFLEHAAEEGETLLNDEPIYKATALRDGDLIRIGRSLIRFGEREKRR